MEVADSADVLEMVRWLAVRVPSSELDEVLAYAREVRPPGIESYADHLAAIVLAIDRVGDRAKSTILEFARMPKEQREAHLDLTRWASERVRVLQGRRPEKSALQDLQLRVREKLLIMFPRASNPKVDGAVLLGVKLTEVGYTVEVGTIVRCMFHPDPYEKA